MPFPRRLPSLLPGLCIAGFVAGVIAGPFAPATAAQQISESFSYPDGTTVPGFTEVIGDWKIASGTLECDANLQQDQFITFDGVTKYACAIEARAYHMDTTAHSRAGVLVRHDASANPTKFMALYLVDVSAPYDGFERYSVKMVDRTNRPFEVFGGVLTPTKRARIRLQVDNFDRAMIFIDQDDDGVWDVIKATATNRNWPGPGSIGLFGRGRARIDDLKYFNATLYSKLIVARIGATSAFEGHGSPGLLYLGGAAFSSTGISLGGGRSIPLAFDPLLLTSRTNHVNFVSFTGFTHPTVGTFGMRMTIPRLPALVGLSPPVAAITCKGTTFPDITHDLRLPIQP